MSPRAITGLGIASTIGVGKEAFYAGLRTPPLIADRAPLVSFDPSTYAGGKQLAQVLEVPNFDPAKYLGDKGLRTLDRLTKLLVVAARLCLHDAGLKKDNHFIASALPSASVCVARTRTAAWKRSPSSIASPSWKTLATSTRRSSPTRCRTAPAGTSASGKICARSTWPCPMATVAGSTPSPAPTCISRRGAPTPSSSAVAKAMSEALFLAFHKLGALSPRALLGEGAALFSLEPA